MTEGTFTLVAGDTDTLLGALPVEAGAMRSRRIFAGTGARVARLSLDGGQIMNEHSAAVPILIQVLSGRVAADIGSERIDLPTGAILHIDAELAHSVEALTAAHLLLILCERAPVVLPPAPKPRRPAGAPAAPARSSARGTVRADAAPSDRARTSNVVLASSGTDSDAIARVTARHAELSGRIAASTAQLLDAAATGDDDRIEHARATVLTWYRSAVRPLLNAEHVVLDPAVRGIAPDLADRLYDERRNITAAIAQLADFGEPIEVATAAVALRVRISHHLRSFDDSALPILAGAPGLPLASLWSQIEAVSAGNGASDPSMAADCECGVVEPFDVPQLDVRDVPHAIRHATVFGALDTVGAGSDGLILVAPHDPLPLLAQIEEREPGRFTVDYLDRGPDAWRIRFSAAPVA